MGGNPDEVRRRLTSGDPEALLHNQLRPEVLLEGARRSRERDHIPGVAPNLVRLTLTERRPLAVPAIVHPPSGLPVDPRPPLVDELETGEHASDGLLRRQVVLIR